MRFENTIKKENQAVGRIEVSVSLCFTGATPSVDKIKEAVSKEFKTEKNLVVIKQVSNVFGDSCINVSAFLYNSKETIKHYEDIKEEKKEEAPKEEKKEEAPKEEKKEEAPKEEKKEEAPKEEKKEEAPKEEKKGE